MGRLGIKDVHTDKRIDRMADSGADGGFSIPVISWFDEPIKKSVNSVFGGINSSVEALDLFKRYRKAHFSMLSEMVGKVKVLGMSAPLPLLDLYYPTRVSSDIRRRLYQSEWVTSGAADKPQRATGVNAFRAIDGDVYVEKCNKLVVLGGPGAGKTTFLKYLALAYSDKDVFSSTKLKTSKLPFFVSLPELSKTELSVQEFITRPLVLREGEYSKEFIGRALKKGLAIMLFDSLDEVPDGRRESVVSRVKDFCTVFPSCKAVLSCRTADYKEVLDSFDEVELVKLSSVAVKKIIRSWFGKDKSSAEKLISVIEADPGLSSLTETPLLLSLLCIQFRHDLVLPRRKVEIYKRCVEALLRDWDTSRGFRRTSAYESLSDDHKERLFEHVAGKVLTEDQSYVISKERLSSLAAEYITRFGLSHADAPAVIEEIESHHGIIEQYSMEAFCFSHASIHDYFMAKYALSRRIEMDLLKSHLEDESWAGVIEFMCGIHAEPEPLFEFMARKASFANLKNYPAIERRAKLLFLMYRCLAVGPVLEPERASAIYRRIIDAIADFSQQMALSGIYAMCTYNGAGVRHPYFAVGSKRPSLHSAMLPFRKLSNEILTKPVPGYISEALAACDALLAKQEFGLTECSTLLNTAIPLSRSAPDEVLVRLSQLKERFSIGWLSNIVDESTGAIKAKQLTQT